MTQKPSTKMTIIIVFILSFICPLITSSAEKQKKPKPKPKPIRTQRIEEAGPDYLIQGEYVGTIKTGPLSGKFGVQVIAWEGAFMAKGLVGGLPGAGWNKSRKIEFKSKTGKDRTILTTSGAPHWTLSIQDGRMAVQDAEKKQVGVLTRVVRKSPTLGKKPPKGALVLFDGTTSKHFITRREKDARDKGQSIEEIPIAISPDGCLVLKRGSRGLFTRKAFQSCFLHLEFRLPFEPLQKGQGRGNSGCYLQGRYEVQILDSFGLEGKENQCGGVYSSGRNPAVNMCFPPLSWQTYDIEFTAPKSDKNGKKISHAKLTVHHNGVLVYKDLFIDHHTTAAPVTNANLDARPHYLQDHGHEMHFKNIWAIEK